MSGGRKYEKPVAKQFIKANVIKYTLLGKPIVEIAENITLLSQTDEKVLADYPEGIKCSPEIVMRYRGNMKKAAGRWYRDLLLKRDDFISFIKDRIDSIEYTKAYAWDQIESNYHLKHSDKVGYLKVSIRCDEDLLAIHDQLKFVADVYPESLEKTPQRSRKPKTGSGEGQTTESKTGSTESAAVPSTQSTVNKTF